MISYNELYVNNAMRVMGRMLDFGVNTLKLGAGTVLELFVATGMAMRFELGDPQVVAGMS